MRRGRELTRRIYPAGDALGDDNRQSDLRRSCEAGRIRQGAGVAMTGGGRRGPRLAVLGQAYDRQRAVRRGIGREVYRRLRGDMLTAERDKVLKLRNKGIMALLYASLAILVYVAFRGVVFVRLRTVTCRVASFASALE